jgi:PAS domain S-box-containing protein
MTSTDHSVVSYRDLAAAIPGCAAVQVGETFTYVADAFATASGARDRVLAGDSWRAAVPQQGTETVQTALDAARADGEWRGKVPLGAAEGEEDAAVEVTLRAIDGGGVVWLLDEQDGKRAASRRMANRTPESGDAVNRAPDAPTVDPAFAQTLLDVVDDVAYVIGEDGFRYWNDALADTTGYSHEELAAMDPQELIPADQQEFVPGLLDALDAIEDRRVDVDILTADGERITHEFTGTTFEDPQSGATFRCGIARDVTGQRERERELERYETIVETVDDGVYVLDDEFRIAYVNDRFCELFDQPRAALLGTDARDLYENASELDVADELREALLDRGDQRGTIEAKIDTGDGERVVESRYRLYPEPDGEYRGSVGVVRDVTEREARTAELRRQRSLIQGILNTIPDVVFAFDEAGEPLVEEAMLDEWAGYGAEELADLGPLGVVPAAERQGVLEQIQSVLEGGETVSYETDVVAKDGTRIPHEFRAAPLELDGEVLGVVGSARDVTERLERERAIARQRDELATLDRINRLLLETTREVVQSGSREAVERAACERLADSELYQFAWVGKQEFDGDRIVPSVTAGEDGGYLEEATITVGEDEAEMEPAGRAIETGVVQIADVGDGGADSWHATASDHGFESVAAVPLSHGDTVYGVLVVYATREDAFSPREQEGFDVVGRSVGAVIHAARNQELLFADAVVELEFRATGGDSLFQRIARELACTLSLDGYVASGDEWILYLAAEGCAPGEFVDTATADDRVERGRVVSETAGGGRVELVVSESLLHAVSAAGASLQSATATPESAELVVEGAAETDVRELVGHVRDEYASVELVATRERDREITTVGRPGGLVSELTDRQRESLEAAYRAGYFAWPRESTAEEVAASLDLAAPTLHGHLRKAEHQLLAALFDAGELGGESS